MLNLRTCRMSIHLWRQVFGTLTLTLLSLSSGITFGYTSVLLPQLRDDKDYPYDRSLDSWIASIPLLAVIPGCFFSGAMSDRIGRRTSIVIMILPFTSGMVCMAFAQDNVMMLVGRFIIGLCTGAMRPVIMVYIAEISEPKNRSFNLICPTLALYLGALISHTVGNCFFWRTSCLVFGLPNILCFLIILLFLKESPLWLISKGRTELGVQVFKMFRGEGENAEEELRSVLTRRREKPDKMTIKIFIQTVLTKAFIKALLTVFILFSAVQLCGVNMISFYAQDIFRSMFSGEINPYKLMLVNDGIRIGTVASVCLFVKIFSCKIIYLLCGFGTALSLGALVVYLCVKPVGILWLATILLLVYISLASALTILSWSFLSEIFPSNVRGFGSGISSGIAFSLLFIAVKVTPGIIATFGETVMFAGCGIITLVATTLLCFILPECSDKTLQNIEDSLYKTDNSGDLVAEKAVMSNID